MGITSRILSHAFFQASSEQRSQQNPPSLNNYSLLRPVFTFGSHEFEAGAAFLAQSCKGKSDDGESDNEKPQNGIIYLLTAHHLFGFAGGLRKNYHWYDLKSDPPSVHAATIDKPSKTISSIAFTPLPGAKGLWAGDASKDIAAFLVQSNKEFNPLPLANITPQKGETVWLYSQLKSQLNSQSKYGADNAPLLHQAIIIDSTEKALVYRFFNKINLRRTSGSPLLNQQGEVVGLHVGGGFVPFIADYGIANPIVAINKMLAADSSD